LVGLHVLQYPVLVDTGGVGKGIAAYDCLVGLHGHVHEAGDHAARGVDVLRVDVCIEAAILVTLERHHHLLERSVAGSFADTIDGHLYLTGTVDHTREGVGSGHSQVLVTVGGEDRILHVDIVDQVADLGTILVREAVTGGIGDIHHSSSCVHHRLYHTGQVLIVCTSRILSIELLIIHEAAGILHCLHRPLDDLLAVG